MAEVDLPAMLAAIRENAEGLTASHYDDECGPGAACTGTRLPTGTWAPKREEPPSEH